MQTYIIRTLPYTYTARMLFNKALEDALPLRSQGIRYPSRHHWQSFVMLRVFLPQFGRSAGHCNQPPLRELFPPRAWEHCDSPVLLHSSCEHPLPPIAALKNVSIERHATPLALPLWATSNQHWYVCARSASKLTTCADRDFGTMRHGELILAFCAKTASSTLPSLQIHCLTSAH
jgi:hypothetical protein